MLQSTPSLPSIISTYDRKPAFYQTTGGFCSPWHPILSEARRILWRDVSKPWCFGTMRDRQHVGFKFLSCIREGSNMSIGKTMPTPTSDAPEFVRYAKSNIERCHAKNAMTTGWATRIDAPSYLGTILIFHPRPPSAMSCFRPLSISAASYRICTTGLLGLQIRSLGHGMPRLMRAICECSRVFSWLSIMDRPWLICPAALEQPGLSLQRLVGRRRATRLLL